MLINTASCMLAFTRTILCLFPFLIIHHTWAQKPLILWYNQPASDWNEALPVGNGRIGAMIFGGTASEMIQLNEQTLWTGGPVNPNPNPDAFNYLQPLRDALFTDSIGKAVKLLRKMQGPNTEMYQPLGNIILMQDYKGEVSNYYRDLNIADAVATTRFTAGGVSFSREIFSSAPDQVLMIHLTANKPGRLNIKAGVSHELDFERVLTKDHQLILRGKARITNDERRNIKPLQYSPACTPRCMEEWSC